MTYVREHDLANAHPLYTKALKKADKTIEKKRKDMIALAQRLRIKAKALLEEASQLESDASRYSEYQTPFATLREEIENAGYWAAREAIGTLPRNEAGEYLEPAPFWNVSYNGEYLGKFQGEERYDILRMVCPVGVDDRRWQDFEVEKI